MENVFHMLPHKEAAHVLSHVKDRNTKLSPKQASYTEHLNNTDHSLYTNMAILHTGDVTGSELPSRQRWILTNFEQLFAPTSPSENFKADRLLDLQLPKCFHIQLTH